jgi:hypothetical protein
VKIVKFIKSRVLSQEFSVRFMTKLFNATAADGGSMFITRQSFGFCYHTALINVVIQC